MIFIDPVTADNILNIKESKNSATTSIDVTGKVTGKFAAGDTVSLLVNNKTFTGTVVADGTYKIAVLKDDLLMDGDTTVDAFVTGTGGTSAKAMQNYGVDTTIPSTLKLFIDLDKDDNGYINGAEKSTATSLTADFSAAKEMVSVGDVLTFKIGTATQDVTIDQTMLQNGKVTLSGWDKEVLPAEGNTLAASVMLKDVAGNATGWFNDTAILDFTGMAFTGQKPDLDTTTSKTILKGIEFSHKMTEDGSFSLSVGSFLYTGKIVNGVTHYDPAPKNFTSEITVTGKEVQLFFTDLAGNQTTSIYDAGTGNSVYPTFTFIV